MTTKDIKIVKVKIKNLKPAEYNPRKASKEEWEQLERSIKTFGLVDPIIVNSNPDRKNIIIGGHFRCKVAEGIGIKEIPVVYINIKDIKKEQELNLRLNKNNGEFDLDLLANMDFDLLGEVGFDLAGLGGDIKPLEDFELDECLENNDRHFQNEINKIISKIMKKESITKIEAQNKLLDFINEKYPIG